MHSTYCVRSLRAICLRYLASCLIFADIYVSTVSKDKVAALISWGVKVKTSVDSLVGLPKKPTIMVPLIVEDVITYFGGHIVE